MSAAKKKSTYVVPPISIDNPKALQETNVTLLASPGTTAHFNGESTLNSMQGSQRLKKSPKFGRSRKVSSKYVLKKNRGTEDNPETGSEDGSATTRPPEPRSRLMKYEEALQILLNGPPDLSQDEILGDSDNEEEESHYTPQIVKLVAGSCPSRRQWTI